MRLMGGVAEKTLDEAAIMAVLESIPDPEIPVLTITDLGIVRGIRHDPPRVLISPTYTGCPATVAIENMIREALDSAGFEDVHVERVLFPPWSTDWITPRSGWTTYPLAGINVSDPNTYDGSIFTLVTESTGKFVRTTNSEWPGKYSVKLGNRVRPATVTAGQSVVLNW